MKNLFLFLTLIFITSMANAKWNPLPSSDASKDSFIYWSNDEGSIIKTASGVNYWHMFDFPNGQTINGLNFKSIKVLSEIDCTKKVYRDIESYWYSENMGKGSVVFSDLRHQSDWQTVVPESNGVLIWQLGKMACDAIVGKVQPKENSTVPKNSEASRSQEQIEFATGSGFFISQDGYFATNYHVIAEAKHISIRTYDGQMMPAKLIKIDQKNDLAILKVHKRTKGIPIEDSSLVKRGASLVAIGFPHINIQGLEPKVTEGIISSLKGVKDDPRFFQISAAVQSGNSGGPLLDSSGNLIGIVSAKLGADLILKETGDLTQNVNYAVKSKYLLLLAYSIPKLKIQLLSPNKKKLDNTAEIFASAEQSVGLVISKMINDEIKSSEAIDESSLPAGFIAQGSLIWAPIKLVTKSHSDALRSCASMADLGFNDWRMPTAKELQSLQFSGKLKSNKNNWNLFVTWSSTKRDQNNYFVVGLGRGEGDLASSESPSETPYAISCVHFNRAEDFHQSVKDIAERIKSGDVLLGSSKIRLSKPTSSISSLPTLEIEALESTNVWWVQGNKLFLRVFNTTDVALNDIKFSFSSTPCEANNKKIWVSVFLDRSLESKTEKVFQGMLPFDYTKVIGGGTKCGLIEGANMRSALN
jgi:hypothetical protein